MDSPLQRLWCRWRVRLVTQPGTGAAHQPGTNVSPVVHGNPPTNPWVTQLTSVWITPACGSRISREARAAVEFSRPILLSHFWGLELRNGQEWCKHVWTNCMKTCVFVTNNGTFALVNVNKMGRRLAKWRAHRGWACPTNYLAGLQIGMPDMSKLGFRTTNFVAVAGSQGWDAFGWVSWRLASNTPKV